MEILEKINMHVKRSELERSENKMTRGLGCKDVSKGKKSV